MEGLMITGGVLIVCFLVLWFVVKPKKEEYHGETYTGCNKRKLVRRGKK